MPPSQSTVATMAPTLARGTSAHPGRARLDTGRPARPMTRAAISSHRMISASHHQPSPMPTNCSTAGTPATRATISSMKTTAPTVSARAINFSFTKPRRPIAVFSAADPATLEQNPLSRLVPAVPIVYTTTNSPDEVRRQVAGIRYLLWIRMEPATTQAPQLPPELAALDPKVVRVRPAGAHWSTVLLRLPG